VYRILRDFVWKYVGSLHSCICRVRACVACLVGLDVHVLQAQMWADVLAVELMAL
jgi:hypothetical protein